MEMLENRMVVNPSWELLEKRLRPEEVKLSGAGYEEIGTGNFVADEDAYQYALERIGQSEELKKELVEWFYSGSWVKYY